MICDVCVGCGDMGCDVVWYVLSQHVHHQCRLVVVVAARNPDINSTRGKEEYTAVIITELYCTTLLLLLLARAACCWYFSASYSLGWGVSVS